MTRQHSSDARACLTCVRALPSGAAHSIRPPRHLATLLQNLVLTYLWPQAMSKLMHVFNEIDHDKNGLDEQDCA